MPLPPAPMAAMFSLSFGENFLGTTRAALTRILLEAVIARAAVVVVAARNARRESRESLIVLIPSGVSIGTRALPGPEN